jgi:hypothetical protein
MCRSILNNTFANHDSFQQLNQVVASSHDIASNQDRASYRWTPEGTGLLLLIDMVIDTEFSEGHQCEKWEITKETIAKMIEAKAGGNEKAMANPPPTSDQVCSYI